MNAVTESLLIWKAKNFGYEWATERPTMQDVKRLPDCLGPIPKRVWDAMFNSAVRAWEQKQQEHGRRP